MNWLFWYSIQCSNFRFNFLPKKWRTSSHFTWKCKSLFWPQILSITKKRMSSACPLLNAYFPHSLILQRTNFRCRKGFAFFILNDRLKNYSTEIDLVRIVKLIKFIFGNISALSLHYFLLATSFLISISRPWTFTWPNNLDLIWNY